MKVLFAGMVAIGAAFCSMNVAASIYVNGVDTSAKTSGGGSTGSATYWRVTDGRIVLRGRGPYVIQGSGTMPIRCSNTGSGVANVTLSNLTVTAKDKNCSDNNAGSVIIYDGRITAQGGAHGGAGGSLILGTGFATCTASTQFVK